jgi:hypothetical protein
MKPKQYISLALVSLAASIVISACNNSNTTTTTPTSPEPPNPVFAPSTTESAHTGGHSGDKKININGAILNERAPFCCERTTRSQKTYRC